MKRGTSARNVLAIPIIYFVISTIMFFANTLTPMLLQSPAYFNIDQSEIGRYTSRTLLWA